VIRNRRYQFAWTPNGERTREVFFDRDSAVEFIARQIDQAETAAGYLLYNAISLKLIAVW